MRNHSCCELQCVTTIPCREQPLNTRPRYLALTLFLSPLLEGPLSLGLEEEEIDVEVSSTAEHLQSVIFNTLNSYESLY